MSNLSAACLNLFESQLSKNVQTKTDIPSVCLCQVTVNILLTKWLESSAMKHKSTQSWMKDLFIIIK